MPDKVFIGKFSKGLTKYYQSFYNDNDSWSTLFNAYVYRGRVERKRGTSLLARLRKQVQMVANATPPAVYQSGQLALVGGVRNLFQATISGITKATQAVVTVNGSIFQRGQSVTISDVVGMTEVNGQTYQIVSVTPTTVTLDVNSTGFTAYVSGGTATLIPVSYSVAPGSISFVVGANTYTDPSRNGTLVGAPAGSGTINYATGDITISGGGVGPLTGTFSYYPGNPVMGLRDFVASPTSINFPVQVSFDTTNAYQINQNTLPSNYFNVTYYKATNTPFQWSGFDYQQFWTDNYSGALWATNNKPGFHFKLLTNTLAGAQSVIRTSATTATIGLTAHGLITGD